MKHFYLIMLMLVMSFSLSAQQQRRPVDNEHPMWLVHVDVWNQADPQKIIDLIPEKIRPYVVMNLSLSCSYDKDLDIYMRPQNAMKTYKSWGTVCQQNGMWFTCQPASGGHTHIQDDDLETFEFMFKAYPNFLGWNYAEQFWGFDEANDKSSSSQTTRIALFAKLVKMHHDYGGFLTISFCGNIWSHALNPVGMMKRNSNLYKMCQSYPESILWLYKYTTSSCFYNNESVTWSPFVAGLATNYGVRYDNCGWNGALDALVGENSGLKYPSAAGYGTVIEQTCVNGGAVWDGPELIWTEDFQNLSNTTFNGYQVRNWGVYPGFKNGWLDIFGKIIDGTLYIPTREEVVKKVKFYVINDVNSGSDEDKYAAWGDLYDGLYKQNDPFNRNNGQWMDNFCYFKRTGRYGTIPVGLAPQDSLAQAIPFKVKKSVRSAYWSTQNVKVNDFNREYPVVSVGDLYVNRYKNQLVTYTPYTYMNSKKEAKARIPLLYNTCDTLELNYSMLSSGVVHEYADHIDFYLNNYRSDTTTAKLDQITLYGVMSEPTYTCPKRTEAAIKAVFTSNYNAETHVYTLGVKHNGPLDITIQCSGNGIDKSQDVVNQMTLAQPVQPQAYKGPITIEAEDMNYKEVASNVNNYYYTSYRGVRGHAGNGFVDMGSSISGSLMHTLNLRADQAGKYRVIIRYGSCNGTGNLTVVSNSKTKYAAISRVPSNQWTRTEVELDLKSGSNNVYFHNKAGISMYIDQVTYHPVGLPEQKYAVSVRDSEHGKVYADADSAVEDALVTLRVEAEEGYRLKELKVLHGGVVLAQNGDDYTFRMSDDNVVLQPQFEETTTVYELDYTAVLSGTIPTGWKCIQGNDEEHAYPNSFGSGARTFAGFTGYQGKALYWREKSCHYGRLSGYTLTLDPGQYKWTFAMAAWKGTPRYNAKIVSASGTVLATASSLSATPNADGSTSANLSSAKEVVVKFDVPAKTQCYIDFTNAGSGFDEFLLLKCQVNLVPSTDGILDMSAEDQQIEQLYTLDGRRVETLQPGVTIVRKGDGTARKVMVK